MRLLPLLTLTGCLLGYGTAVQAEPAITVKDSAVINAPIMAGNLEPISTFLLSSIGKRTSVHLIINSPGGAVDDGFSFISKMEYAKSMGVTINCYVPEVAASMAFQILLHCDHRYALKRAGLLFHRVAVMAGRGSRINSIDASDLLRSLLALDKQIIEDLISHMDTPKSTLLFHLDKETMHLATDMNELSPGFFDDVVETIPGLFEAVASADAAHQANALDFLKRLFGNQFIYMKRGTYLETVPNSCPTRPN